MLTQIVVLYMVYTMELPKRCAMLVWIELSLNFVKFCYELWKSGRD